MTRLPAAPRMTTLGEAIHPDAPNGAVAAVVRLRVAGPGAVTGGVRGDRTVTWSAVLEAGQIARVSGAARC